MLWAAIILPLVILIPQILKIGKTMLLGQEILFDKSRNIIQEGSKLVDAFDALEQIIVDSVLNSSRFKYHRVILLFKSGKTYKLFSSTNFREVKRLAEGIADFSKIDVSL